jgi:hypothetical protein
MEVSFLEVYQLYSMCQTHCRVSSVDWHAVRASVDEDGTNHIGRRQERGLRYRWRRAVLIAEGQSIKYHSFSRTHPCFYTTLAHRTPARKTEPVVLLYTAI